MADRGFDLDERVAGGETERPTLAPADRVGARRYAAAPPGGELPVLERAEELVFASNNYLGLTSDGRVQDAARRAAAVVGTGAGASRLATGDTLVHHDVERLLAETLGTDRALVFPSAYAAAVGTIAALEPDVVFVDEASHARVVDGCRLAGSAVVRYDHCDADALRAAMADRAERATADESWLVVTASVFGADGAVAPLRAICDAADAVGAWVLVDESHAVGLYVDGGGIVQAEGLDARVQVQLGSLSTALASQGGYVAGDDALIERLLASARPFAHSAGLAPTSAAAASEALHLARHTDVRERLWDNVAHLRDGLETMGYTVLGEAPFLPVAVGNRRDALALADGVRERGAVTRPIVPPTVPAGASRVRVSPMASHDHDEIVTCLEAFQATGEELGLL